MRPVEESRRLRLLQLKEQFGSWADLNKLLENSARDSTLSQIANSSTGSKTNKAKAMGSPLARRLESVCKKPVGWMDSDPDEEWPFANVDRTALKKLSPEQMRALEGAINSALTLVGLGESRPETLPPARTTPRAA